jgi:hypothetical protein
VCAPSSAAAVQDVTTARSAPRRSAVDGAGSAGDGGRPPRSARTPSTLPASPTTTATTHHGDRAPWKAVHATPSGGTDVHSIHQGVVPTNRRAVPVATSARAARSRTRADPVHGSAPSAWA